MAAVNLGSSSVPGNDATITPEISGSALTIGQSVYRDTADGKIRLISTATTTIDRVGIATTTVAAVNQRCMVMWDGTLNSTATLVAGESYFASDTPGSVWTESELGTGDRVTFLGVAASTTSLRLKPFASGIVHGADHE